MFIDRAVVQVTAGTGGSGASSFARFKYKAKGGPDGGDGGRGGSVYVEGDANLATLLDYRYRTHWKAGRGEHGKGKTQTGASADDVVMPIPPGTELRDADSGELIGEVLRSGQRILVARGGRGGWGNAHYATATHQAPREWQPGAEGQERRVELVLKLLADVGLVGEPNAGKSTLLSVLSAARPKIADYPFTTLEPNLGVMGLGDGRSIVIADIPGIIEGAHEGKGLGLKFLQHVERTRVLAFLVPVDAEDPQAVFEQLRTEVREYSPSLYRKPYVLLLTKRDLLASDADLPGMSALDARWISVISAASGAGIAELRERLWALVKEERTAEEDLASTDDGVRRPLDYDEIEWDDDPGPGPQVSTEDLLNE